MATMVRSCAVISLASAPFTHRLSAIGALPLLLSRRVRNRNTTRAAVRRRSSPSTLPTPATPTGAATVTGLPLIDVNAIGGAYPLRLGLSSNT